MAEALSGTWLRLDSGPASAARNMAMDHALMEFAVSTALPVLRFYSWTEPAATFGYSQRFADVERFTILRPLVRRPTGGGLVPHDADWTYSVVLPPGTAWHELKAEESYRLIHEWVSRAFGRVGIQTELAAERRKSAPGQCFEGWEKNDVLWHGRKIAGAAQRRNRHGLLIQGSVQPPPVRVERSYWENAMTEVAREHHKVFWNSMKPCEGLSRRADELEKDFYSNPQYNRKK
jgi:lipoate-protein ligase A